MIGQHGDKTMFTNANIRPANDAVWSATAPTRALTEGNGSSENAYGRPHAPRSGAPNNTALTGRHFDIGSASELRSATHRSRISDCAPASPRLLARIRASNRRRIGGSPSDRVSQIDSRFGAEDAPRIRVRRQWNGRLTPTVGISLRVTCSEVLVALQHLLFHLLEPRVSSATKATIVSL